jgi:hypothetical protein
MSNQIVYSQLLPPQAVSYERTGRTAIELSWLAPNSNQPYALYDLTDWLPKTYFSTKPATPRMQDCVISDGKFIYTSSADFPEGQFLKFDLTGNLLETFTISGMPHIYKMAYDGTYFYGIQYENPGIYQLDMDNKKLVSIIPTQKSLLHICYVPTLDNGNGGFEAGNPSEAYYFKKDGTYISAGPNFTAYGGATSTAYSNGILYAFCQNQKSLREIVEFNAETLQPTGKSLDLSTLIGQAGISTSQMADDLTFYEYPDGILNALVTSYYTTTTEVGTIVSFFEIGKRPFPTGLQGYNVYRNDVKQNTGLLNASVYAYQNTGLSEETDYTYKMTAVYDETESPASPNLTVRLPASNQLPFVEDFSSGSYTKPNFWEISPTANSPVWKITTTTAGLGESLPSLSYSYAYSRDYEQTFVSQPLKSSASLIKLRYDVACSRSLANENLLAEVEVDGTWHTVATETSNKVSSSWQTKEWDITSPVKGKDFQLRFRVAGAGGNTSYYWYLDNIRIWTPEYIAFGGIVRAIDIPIADAAIRLTKTDDPGVVYETVSNASGNFLFAAVEKGSYRLNVFQDGTEPYENTSYQITTENTNAVLVLPGSRIQVDNSPIHVLLGENKTKNVLLPVSNSGNIQLNWNAEIEYKTGSAENGIGNSNVSGEPFWEAQSPFDLENSREVGLVLHKNHYYTIGDKSYNPLKFPLREYSTTGELLHTYTITSPDYIVIGLVSDGETLYEITVPEDHGSFSPSVPGKLIPFDLENNTVDESRAIVTDFDEINAMTYAVYDPVHDGFYVGGSHVFYRIDRSGKVQKTYDGIIYSYTKYMALDTFSEGGPYMWLFCEKNVPGYGGETDRANILKFSLKDETMTNVTHSTMDIPGYDTTLRTAPVGFFGTTTLIPSYFVLGGSISYANSHMNEKASLFIYKMFPYLNWLSLPERTGEVVPGASGEFAFDLNTHSLHDGEEYEASIILHSGSKSQDVEIPVKLTVDNSAETNCEAPQNLMATLTATYGVQLTWSLPAGAPPVKGYRVFRNGKSIQDGLIANELFVDALPGMATQTYTVRAFYESGCESYDSEPVEIEVTNPEIILPVGELTASVVNKRNVQVKWAAPKYGTGFFDDFESYPAFAIRDIGNWKLVDGDKSWTYYDASLVYPNEGSPMAFMVFNPSACTPSSSITTYDNKNQMLACFGANVDKLSNNDWLISPALDFDRPFVFSFIAKTHSLSYGFEKINIGYSLTGNNPEDFTFINGNRPVNVGEIWEKQEYSIPAGAKYVAINCVTTNGFILFIDNIYVGHPEYYSELLGYTIYRNGEKQHTALLKTNQYIESGLANGTYTYEVEALFANGTSSKTSATAIINYSYEATAPLELKAERQEKSIQLSWLSPASVGQEELRYDNGKPYDSMGADEKQYMGIRWNSSDLETYVGYSITGVQFYIAEPALSVVPFLYEGDELIAGGEEITAAPGQYTTYRFDTPVVIKPGAEYIAGYSCIADANSYPVSHDAGPAVAWKGDLISTNGLVWYSASQLWGEEFSVNWNLAMLVELDSEGEFQGYNLYRNDAKVNTNPLSGLAYTDADDGLRKEYYVTAVYKTAGEKPSNHVIVEAVGIKDVHPLSVAVYPNPARDRLYVKGEYDTLELVSLEGKSIRKMQFKGEVVTEIDIQSVLPGMYLLGVQKGDSTEYHKIIVSN